MGIKYMSRFIHKYGVRLLADFNLKDEKLIIDGSELLYYLYFDCLSDKGRCGGEYSQLRQITNDFFDAMSKCHINSFVVFDGFKSENDIGRYLKTRTDKLISMRNIVEDNAPKYDTKAMPLLGKDVLKQTLFELSIPFIVIPGDGDPELAAIANVMNAFVLASDTDFCVVDLKRGFLPFDDFQWQEVIDKGRESCHCKIFHRNILSKTFGTPLPSIVYLEPILSNQEGLSNDEFNAFVNGLARTVRRPNHLPHSRRPDYLETILLWLGKHYRNQDQIIRLIAERVRSLSEDKFKECLLRYLELPDVQENVDTLLQGGHNYGVHFVSFHHIDGSPVPANYLPIVPDNQDGPSSHKIGANIRKGIYQVGFEKMRVSGIDIPDELKVLETDRQGREYRADMVLVTLDRDIMKQMRLDLRKDDLRQREDMNDILQSRERFIIDLLLCGEDRQEAVRPFANDDSRLLLAAVLKYWSSSEDERQTDEAKKALAFTISAVFYGIDSPDTLARIPENKFDKLALHSSTQWLICMHDTVILNNVLDEPMATAEIGKLFSGKLHQRAFSYFVDNNDIDGADHAVRLFKDNVEARQFFQDILEVIE